MRYVVGWLALLMFACSEAPEDLAELYSLTDRLPLAEVALEAPVLDLGTPGSRGALREGWSYSQTGRDGSTFVWAVGPRSSVDVFVAEPRDLELFVTARPFPFDEAPPQSARVRFNDADVGQFVLEPGLREYRLPIPESATRAGANRLSFEWARQRLSSGEPSSRDRRRLTARLDRIELRGLATPVPPALADSSGLRLSAGSELSYFLALDPGVRLEVAEVSSPGRDLWLEVLFQLPGEDRRTLGRWPSGGGGFGVELPATGGPARLTLRAVDDTTSPDGSLRLDSPLVVGPRNEPAVPPQPGPETTSVPERQRPNVVIWVVDTLRADHLGCYGYSRDTSPHIDAFAAEAVLFEHTIAQSSWTKPTVASLFTGLTPTSHGVNRRDVGLGAEIVTMAEIFAGVGYRTAGFVGNAYLTSEAGYDQGFETFELSTDEHADGMTRRALDWLDGPGDGDEAEVGGPFLLLLHTMEPHAPYAPAPELRERFSQDTLPADWGGVQHLRELASRATIDPEVVGSLLDLYDAEVAWNDRGFGALVAGLRQRGLFDDSIVVFAADHGEAFNERGIIGHGWDLHAEALHVPMILRTPSSVPGRRVDSLVRQIDLLPTLLSATGIAAPGGMEGDSLVPFLGKEAPGSGRDSPPAISLQTYDGRDAVSVTTSEWKLVVPLTRKYGVRAALYDRRSDPGEQFDVAEYHPVITGYLRATALAELEKRRPDGPSIEIDDETRQRLQALGYVVE